MTGLIISKTIVFKSTLHSSNFAYNYLRQLHRKRLQGRYTSILKERQSLYIRVNLVNVYLYCTVNTILRKPQNCPKGIHVKYFRCLNSRQLPVDLNLFIKQQNENTVHTKWNTYFYSKSKQTITDKLCSFSQFCEWSN